MIDITVDARKALGFLSDAAEKQIPFAVAKMLNATGLDMQKAERAQMERVFDIRRKDFADRSVKITHFAKKSEPFLVIGIHPPGAQGESRKDIFTKFEVGGPKTPTSGRTIAVPVSRVGLRATKAGILTRGARPRALINAGKAFVVRKKLGTVGEGLILQRIGFGRGGNRRSSVVALFYLVRKAQIDPDLRFIPTAFATANATWRNHMLSALDQALRTAK